MAFGSQPVDSNNWPIANVYVPGTGFKALQGGTAFTDASSNDSSPVRFELTSPSKATYCSAIYALNMVSGATDVFTLTGSASKLVKVLRVEFSATQITASAAFDARWVKRSTADTAGTTTSTNLYTAPVDSSMAAASATVLAYTANPTLGTQVGAPLISKYLIQLTSAVPQVIARDFANIPGGPITLRGTSDVFAFNMNGQTFNTNLTDMVMWWTEE
jgi:hypothetical protein